MTESKVSTLEGARPPRGADFDWELGFLGRFADPLLLVARVMLAYVFIVEGYGKIGDYTDVAAYMAQHDVAPMLLPFVILTELGCGLLVLIGLATRWAAIALGGFCLLTALLFHMGADEAIEFKKNVAIAGGFVALASFGAGSWSIDGWRRRSR